MDTRIMDLSFYKYHGTGNDFILLDDRNREFDPEEGLIRHLCDRRFGIGADGLILIREDDSQDFSMLYFNADGQEGSLCGNGGRCAVAFAERLIPGKDSFSFTASDGKHKGLITDRDNDNTTVRLSMNPVTIVQQKLQGYFLDTGSPHYVIFVDDNEHTDVLSQGRELRNNKAFRPGGTNVNFVSTKDRGIINVRTYERGVEDETLSCGTGVTASALAHAAASGLDQGTISVETRGGMLSVEFKKDHDSFHDIWLKGPAVMVFKGRITNDD